MKIVVLDGYAANPNDISWDAMASLGELTVYDRTPWRKLPAVLATPKLFLPIRPPLQGKPWSIAPT